MALGLGVCPARSAAPPHRDDLRTGDPAIRRHAAAALGRLGDRAVVPDLLTALEDDSAAVRREVARALGRLRDARAVEPLLRALRDDDLNVRFYAAFALGEIKDAKAVDGLLTALRDGEWTVRNQAAWALREIGSPAAVAPLVSSLALPNADVTHALWVLRHTPAAEAVPPLIELLAAPKTEARVRAAGALGEIRDARAVAPLIQALRDREPSVRLAALRALLRLDDERAEEPVKRLAAAESDAAVRAAAEAAVKEMEREEGLAAHWSFDDRSTTVAKDITGGGNDGEIKGCAPAEGKVGAALRFDEGKYIELGQPTDLPLAGQPLTVCAWAKPEARNGVVVARGGTFVGFSLYVMDGVPKFGIHRIKDGPMYVAAGSESVVGAWAHLAGVVKQDRIELYVNGKLAAAEKTPGYIPSNCGQGMEIGFDVATSPAEICDAFKGVIDEVKVYRAALSEKELTKQLAATK